MSQSFSSPLEIHLFLDAWMGYSLMEMTKEYQKLYIGKLVLMFKLNMGSPQNDYDHLPFYFK